MNTENKKEAYFHFTIGPVQGFVAQARRTRDFWAGSFILSWLAAVAIKAVQHQGGEINFPEPDDDYMDWLIGEGKNEEPKQGSIPNRFKGLVATVDPNTFKPEQVTSAVQEAWQALADCVWEEDLKHISKAPKSREIWQRQIRGFWDMTWVITEDKEDSAALDKRKNWRTYWPPAEAGVKCMMMDGWQELSGEESPNRKNLNSFWEKVQKKGRNGIKSDLKENEALCAMGFIKRRFSRHFNKLEHTMEQGWQLKGWEVPSAVPSVSYMAALHWLEQALKEAHIEDLRTFHDAAAELVDKEYGEWDTHINCLQFTSNIHEFKRLRSLNGDVFFETQLENKRQFENQEKAKKVINAIKAINQSAEIEPVSPFYAVLIMDGDSLGSHMSDTKNHSSITSGLAEFTKGVPKIVKQKNGFLIYAGGDDVLAILPLEDAIPCASALREYYLQCFDKQTEDIPTTLSGAIQFAHIKMPLTSVLKDAHDLLDNIAKEGTGRDALAIRVWKPGGLQLQWSQPWEIALIPETQKTYLEQITEDFKAQDRIEGGIFSSKFFYKIRERFDLLNPHSDHENSLVLNEDEAMKLMAMEYLNSGKSDLSNIKNAKEKMNKACDRVRPLLKQCRPVIRDKEKKKQEWKISRNLEVDGALLVRFLANKGVE
jgi:CRISPR-associated protein Cmr2